VRQRLEPLQSSLETYSVPGYQGQQAKAGITTGTAKYRRRYVYREAAHS